eukprot:340860_1
METFVYFIFMVSLWSFGQCGIGNWLCCNCCCGYLGRQRDKVHASHTNSSRNTFNNLIFSAEDAASCWNGSRGFIIIQINDDNRDEIKGWYCY